MVVIDVGFSQLQSFLIENIPLLETGEYCMYFRRHYDTENCVIEDLLYSVKQEVCQKCNQIEDLTLEYNYTVKQIRIIIKWREEEEDTFIGVAELKIQKQDDYRFPPNYNETTCW